MEDKDIKSIIESILFVWGEPLHIKELVKVLNIPKGRIKEYIYELQKEMEEQRRGIQLIEVNDCFQLATRLENHPYIEKMCITSPNRGLSQPTLEVLAIIAYRQPITRHEIEVIRGVKCDKPISTLMDRDLIEIKGRLEKTGRPIVYGTTDTFLKAFGFKNLDDLPQIEAFNDFEILKQEA
ncbi:SMC-Scp complex subunit ScpB [Paramaledivibacter caminithermalis]|jgi:segregation and condensation protein B|uniref:Segregation and condensation protein B n=1 Tax=Paramaledivibacter caminithermalis (strain DSM 15212 / CIP 107654 / DViRD3) TaxID=1121301 RepID=A0A1M6JNL8_PARC5|nr:SMC-Scp complex subunit ScpB [Paramaledivibacter caminithermalis]SHJ48345.1 condensin subunit ScpB [Paramaledivibacter caminithermalis DSM 15212]